MYIPFTTSSPREVFKNKLLLLFIAVLAIALLILLTSNSPLLVSWAIAAPVMAGGLLVGVGGAIAMFRISTLNSTPVIIKVMAIVFGVVALVGGLVVPWVAVSSVNACLAQGGIERIIPRKSGTPAFLHAPPFTVGCVTADNNPHQ